MKINHFYAKLHYKINEIEQTIFYHKLCLYALSTLGQIQHGGFGNTIKIMETQFVTAHAFYMYYIFQLQYFFGYMIKL